MCTWRRTVRKTVNVLENSVTTSGYIKESQKVLPLGLCVGVSIWRKFSGEMEIWEPTEEQRSLHDKKRMYIGHGWLMHLNWGFVFLQNVIEEGSGFGFFFFFSAKHIGSRDGRGEIQLHFLLLCHLGQET